VPFLFLLLAVVGVAAASSARSRVNPRAEGARRAQAAAQAASAGTRHPSPAPMGTPVRVEAEPFTVPDEFTTSNAPHPNVARIVDTVATLDPERIGTLALQLRDTFPEHAHDLEGVAASIRAGRFASQAAAQDAGQASWLRTQDDVFRVAAPAATTFATYVNPVAGAIVGLALSLFGSPSEREREYLEGQRQRNDTATRRARAAESAPGSDPEYDEWVRLGGRNTQRPLSTAALIGWTEWSNGRRSPYVEGENFFNW